MVNERDMIIDIKVRERKFHKPFIASFVGKDARDKAIAFLKSKR